MQYDGAFPYVVSRGAEAFNLMGSMVSAEFFEVLGALPAAGRLLDRRDVAPDAPGAIVISYDLWQRRFGGDPAIVGTPLGFDYSAYDHRCRPAWLRVSGQEWRCGFRYN